MLKILILGSSGFIGHTLLKYDWSKYNLSCPDSFSANVADIYTIEKYIKDADIVLNLAAYTNTKLASLDKNEPAWQTNVIGSENVSRLCQIYKRYLIYISTNAVFPNYLDNKSDKNEESSLVPNLNNLSIYGYTKLLGEMEAMKNGNTAILRISYPFGNTEFAEKDYVMKIIKASKLGLPLFNDQFINLTYIKHLYKILLIIFENRKRGVFHIVSRDESTPYDIFKYLNEKLCLDLCVKQVSVKTSIPNHILYNSHEYISTKITEESLNTRMPSIFECIDNFIDINKKYFDNQR